MSTKNLLDMLSFSFVAGMGLTKLLCNLLFLLAARQSMQAHSALAPQRPFEHVVLALTPAFIYLSLKQKKECLMHSFLAL